jgi:hypothetical protein
MASYYFKNNPYSFFKDPMISRYGRRSELMDRATDGWEFRVVIADRQFSVSHGSIALHCPQSVQATIYGRSSIRPIAAALRSHNGQARSALLQTVQIRRMTSPGQKNCASVICGIRVG